MRGRYDPQHGGGHSFGVKKVITFIVKKGSIVHHADCILWMVNYVMFIHVHVFHLNPSTPSISGILHNMHV